MVDLGRRAFLLHGAAFQHHDAVGDGQRVAGVVGDEEGGGAALLEDGPRFVADGLAQAGVEAAEGLVEQQHPRVGREGAGEGDALAFAAGEFVRVAAAEF